MHLLPPDCVWWKHMSILFLKHLRRKLSSLKHMWLHAVCVWMEIIVFWHKTVVAHKWQTCTSLPTCWQHHPNLAFWNKKVLQNNSPGIRSIFSGDNCSILVTSVVAIFTNALFWCLHDLSDIPSACFQLTNFFLCCSLSPKNVCCAKWVNQVNKFIQNCAHKTLLACDIGSFLQVVAASQSILSNWLSCNTALLLRQTQKQMFSLIEKKFWCQQ